MEEAARLWLQRTNSRLGVLQERLRLDNSASLLPAVMQHFCILAGHPVSLQHSLYSVPHPHVVFINMNKQQIFRCSICANVYLLPPLLQQKEFGRYAEITKMFANLHTTTLRRQHFL